MRGVLPVPRVLWGARGGRSVSSQSCWVSASLHMEHPYGHHGFSMGCSAGWCEEQCGRVRVTLGWTRSAPKVDLPALGTSSKCTERASVTAQNPQRAEVPGLCPPGAGETCPWLPDHGTTRPIHQLPTPLACSLQPGRALGFCWLLPSPAAPVLATQGDSRAGRNAVCGCPKFWEQGGQA